MPKIIIILSLFFIYNIAQATNSALNAFTQIDTAYLQKLETCTSTQKIQTLQFGEDTISLYQEIEGLKDNKCKFTLGVVEEYFLHCNLAQNELKIIVDYLKYDNQSEKEFIDIINNTNNCLVDTVSNNKYFKDNYGVEFNCDTPMNVQMVKDEECRKCKNRTIVEDSKVVLEGKPLTYCVLKFCPPEYTKNQNGKCVKHN